MGDPGLAGGEGHVLRPTLFPQTRTFMWRLGPLYVRVLLTSMVMTSAATMT